MTAFTKRSRYLAALCHLSVGVGLLTSNFDPALASRSTSATSRLGHNSPLGSPVSSSAVASVGVSITPIVPACPFPFIPLSEAGSATAFGVTTDVVVESTATFTRGDGSDADLGMTIGQLVTEGKLDEALAIAQQIRAVDARNSALRQIMSAHVEAGRLEQALEVALRIVDPPETNSSIDAISYRDNALSEIAQAYLEAEQLESALHVTEYMSQAFAFSSLLDIAQKYQERGQLEQAAQSLERAVAAYRADIATKNYPAFFRVIILARIVNGYVVIGQPEPALEFAAEVFDLAQTLPGQDMITLGILTGMAGVYRAADQPDRATTILAYVLQATETLAAPFERAIVLTGIAKEYAAADQRDRADEFLAQARALAQSEADVSNRNVALVSIAQSYGTLGQYDQALQVTTAIEPSTLRDEVQQALTCSQSLAAMALGG